MSSFKQEIVEAERQIRDGEVVLWDEVKREPDCQ